MGSDVFTLGVDESSEQPPLKKFKALFDASHPDRTGANTFDENALEEEIQSVTLGSFSQTQSQSQAASKAGRLLKRSANAPLGVLREEEEESQSGTASLSDQRGKKRSIQDLDEDVELGDIESVTLTSRAEPGGSKAKKRALENVNVIDKTSDQPMKPTSMQAIKPSSNTNIPKTAKGGALPGQPDKDAAFLKAIASTKRGRKAEDEFDRDFNKLKISKPDLVREEPEKEWAILGEFGDETNVRGNFMVVIEMAVFNNGEGVKKTRDAAPKWQGKPNYKKFKKVFKVLC